METANVYGNFIMQIVVLFVLLQRKSKELTLYVERKLSELSWLVAKS